MTSGGKRKGAGRKASDEGKRVTMSCRVLPSTLDYLRTKEEGIGKTIDNYVKKDKENEQGD